MGDSAQKPLEGGGGPCSFDAANRRAWRRNRSDNARDADHIVLSRGVGVAAALRAGGAVPGPAANNTTHETARSGSRVTTEPELPWIASGSMQPHRVELSG